ncbi:hypothetical protein GUG48_06690, partial [Xanthomonas citri pv. citri]|nr:hypothetical protein [Xanthomonas citri pv. citri]
IDQYRRDTDPSADPRLEIQPQLAVVAEDIAAARLRVKGVTGLRVADASVMPEHVTVNPNITCFMIGEKAAQLILADRA